MGNQIIFSEARKGYDKEEVDRYVQQLQQGVIELDQENKSIADLLDQKKRELIQKEKESENNPRLSAYEQEILTLKKQLKEGREKLNKAIEDANAVNRRLISIEQDNQLLKEALEKEKKKVQEKGEVLSKETESQKLSRLFLKAQEHADLYVAETKERMEQEERAFSSQKEELLQQARQEAEQIIARARAEKLEELDVQKEALEKKLKEAQEECEFQIQECEDMKASAAKEAETIIAQAKIRMEYVEKREQEIIARAEGKAERIRSLMETDYQQMQTNLKDTVQRYMTMYSYMKEMDGSEDEIKIAKLIDLPELESE